MPFNSPNLGCIVRHLVLPLAAYDSVNVVKFVSTLPESVYFSLMAQYTPFGETENFKELQRKITPREYSRVLDEAERCGLANVFKPFHCQAHIRP